MPNLMQLLAVLALAFVVLSVALERLPLWVGVFVLCVVVLIQVWGR